jgi:hypothetical protein
MFAAITSVSSRVLSIPAPPQAVTGFDNGTRSPLFTWQLAPVEHHPVYRHALPKLTARIDVSYEVLCARWGLAQSLGLL